jgi:hypothetical protein
MSITLDFASAEAEERMDPGVLISVLRALATMARGSKRHQAELGVALQRAGLTLPIGTQTAALRRLTEDAAIDQVIPLDDGGVLLSVTSAGMQRAG